MAMMFWTILGFVGGIIMSQNSRTMSHTETLSIFFAMFVGCGIMWFMGYRGKSSAVATAVATAVSIANSQANAHARSVASSAINLYLGQQAGVSPELLGAIVEQSVEEIKENAIDASIVNHTDSEKEVVST